MKKKTPWFSPGDSTLSKVIFWGALILMCASLGYSAISLVIRYREARFTPLTPAPIPTGDAHADDFRHLTWLLHERWSWLEMRAGEGLDLGALQAESIATYEEEGGERGFLRGLTRYLSGLSDGHAYVRLEGVDLKEDRQWPFCLIEVEEGIMVDGLCPTLYAMFVLEIGDLVLSVNGRPIGELIREQERFVFASMPAARRRKAIRDLTESTRVDSLQVEVLKMGTTDSVVIEVPTVSQEEPLPHLSWKSSQGAESYLDHVEIIDDQKAYLRIAAFSPKTPKAEGEPFRDEDFDESYDDYANFFEQIADRSDLILDLRNNGGGSDFLGQALGLHLMPPGFRYLQMGRLQGGDWKTSPFWSGEYGRGEPRFDGRVICLIDEFSFSVTDNFTSCLRDERENVVFMGQPASGGSGAPKSFELPGTGAKVYFCTARVTAPNGTYVEGHGVQPDILVRATRADILAEADAILEAAMALR
jgi:C-terminal processing protease CtpA/Prc